MPTPCPPYTTANRALLIRYTHTNKLDKLIVQSQLQRVLIKSICPICQLTASKSCHLESLPFSKIGIIPDWQRHRLRMLRTRYARRDFEIWFIFQYIICMVFLQYLQGLSTCSLNPFWAPTCPKCDKNVNVCLSAGTLCLLKVWWCEIFQWNQWNPQ